MHLEGKIHQGFLKLRTEIETLKIRLEIAQAKIDKNKEKAAIANPPLHADNHNNNKADEERDREREK